jgi:L-ascorbate metabolism protein UlaG (beta-lactamase superfamily)
MDLGNVKIDFLGHSGFLVCIKSNGNSKRIFIDPYNISENSTREKADLILITHSHYDHCSIKDIQRIVKQGTKIIIPADVQSKITKIENIEMQVIEVGDELEIGNVRIQGMAAYNIGKDFHTKKDNFLGYLIKSSGVIIYYAGDTDKIPEMEKLTGHGKEGNNFIALLPVSGETVMTANEAADAAELINPDIAIPMHYGAGVVGTLEDAQLFVKACQQLGIHAEILEKI